MKLSGNRLREAVANALVIAGTLVGSTWIFASSPTALELALLFVSIFCLALVALVLFLRGV